MANRKTDIAKDSAALWVAVLERGRLTHDFELVRQATAELERLGVQVTFGDKSPGKGRMRRRSDP